MLTSLQLLAQRYNSPAILLTTAYRDFVNGDITDEQINRKACNGEIPFDCYKPDGKRSKWFVKLTNLAKWIDNQ